MYIAIVTVRYCCTAPPGATDLQRMDVEDDQAGRPAA